MHKVGLQVHPPYREEKKNILMFGDSAGAADMKRRKRNDKCKKNGESRMGLFIRSHNGPFS